MNCFIWSENSIKRNQLTEQHEALQPFLFLSFIHHAGAKVVIDIGANVGYYSLVSTLAESVEVVHSFEPDTQAFKEMEKNLTLNAIQRKVSPHQVIVSNMDGTTKFGSHSPMSGINGVVETSIHEASLYKEVRELKSIKLDSLTDLRGRVLALKIDVEGHEISVLEGAKELLTSSPCIVQIECFFSDKIEQVFRELGYFKFFTAGQDFYFSNINNFSDLAFVNKAIGYAVSYFTEVRSERHLKVDTIKNSVDLTLETEKKIEATVTLSEGYFDNPEVAFYLLVDGKKTSERWYSLDRKASFSFPDYEKEVEVKAFVREAAIPEKKVVVGKFIKEAPKGYRAESAIPNSYGSPSKYLSYINKLEKNKDHGYFDIDISPLIHTLKQSCPNNLIILGSGPTVTKTLEAAVDFRVKNCHVFSNSKNCVSSLVNFSKILTHGKNSQVKIYYVENDLEIGSLISELKIDLIGRTYILFLDQFYSDLNFSLVSFRDILTGYGDDKIFFAERLVNDNYSKMLRITLQETGFKFISLIPKSKISGFSEKEKCISVETNKEGYIYFLSSGRELNFNDF